MVALQNYYTKLEHVLGKEKGRQEYLIQFYK